MRAVLLELYLRIPGCFNSLLTSGELQLVSALSLTSSSLTSQSVLDTYTHTLLSALAATQVSHN